MEFIKGAAGIEMVHIPYKGSPPAIVDLISGRVDTMFTQVPPLLDYIRSGRLRALAVTSARRWPRLPSVPTMVESGYEGFIADTFFGLLAPAKTPPEIIAKLTATAVAVLGQPATIERLQRSGYDVAAKGPDALTARIKHELGLWKGIVKQAGIGVK